MDLQEKNALVTGASRGIGLAIAEGLVAAGMNVMLTSRNASEVEQVAERLDSGLGAALGVACDVRSLSDLETAVSRTVEAFGGLDLLVANAGVGHFGPVDALSVDAWQSVIDTNLTGVFLSVKAAVPALKRSHGMIVTIGSLAGANFFAGGSAYNASKFGLLGFSQAIMLDLRPHGIRVSTVMPGSVATSFSDRGPAEADAWKIQPEDLADTVLYLAHMPARTLPSKVEVRPSLPPQR